MFKVHLRKFNRVYYKLEGYVGNMPPADADSPASSVINFIDNGNRFAWDARMQSAYFVALDDNNNGIAGLITGHSESGGLVSSITLDTEILDPNSTLKYMIVNFESTSTYVDPGTEIVDISPYIEGLVFESMIEHGFSLASIDIGKHTARLAKIFTRAGGWDVMIYGPLGERVWQGVVVSSNVDGLGGQIECAGYFITNQWFYAQGVYGQGDATVTAPRVIREQLQYNVYVRKDNMEAIDRGDTLDTAQQTTVGLGAIDYEEAPMNLEEAVQLVTRYGYYPIDTEPDVSADLALQFWFDRIPETKKIIQDYKNLSPDWYLYPSNFSEDLSGIRVENAFSDFVGVQRAVYTGLDGETSYTSSVFKFPQFLWFGPMERQVASGSLSIGEALNVMRDITNKPVILTRPGAISITGRVRRGSGTISSPAYLIRAGDVVLLSVNDNSVYPPDNSVSIGIKFIVGKTSYNVNDGTMTLGLYGHSDNIERQVALMDLETL